MAQTSPKGKQANKKKNTPDFKDKILKWFESVFHTKNSYSRIKLKLINTVKVFIAATKKFMRDDCLTRASSIAYTTIISLIPTLFVGLTFYSIFSGEI